jgi:dTDP-4-dehydrorhamnose 3,5-epimerase
MSLDVRQLSLDGLVEIRPRRHGDARGFFSETFNAREFGDAGLTQDFVQDNHSYSAAKGVLRGLHYQLDPYAQAKLVRVISGAILDVAVDLRPGSRTFGKWASVELSAQAWNQVFVPVGFAHGFVTLEPHTSVFYKTTQFYAPSHDRAIRFDDPDIGIEWPFAPEELTLSDKDRNAPFLRQADMLAFS